jgi:hypothetical protein
MAMVPALLTAPSLADPTCNVAVLVTTPAARLMRLT